MALVGSWSHWKKLLKRAWFRECRDRWKEELEIKLRSDAIKEMIEQSKGIKGGPAARWLAEKGWAPTRGRPSKDEVAAERKQQAGIKTEIDELYDRATATH
jgi:hypothetical protein